MAVAIALLVVALRAAAVWRAGGPSWPELLRDAAGRARADLPGSLLLVAGLGMLAVTTWQLPPLVIPALGCLLMGGVAVERRIS